MIRVRPSRVAAVAVTGLLVALLVLSLSADTASAKSKYRTYAFCGGPSFPGGKCGPNNLWGAAIISKRHNKRFKYKVCLKTPRGNKSCDKRRANRGGEGYKYLNRKYDGNGKYRITWKVGGRFAGRDKIVITGGETV